MKNMIYKSQQKKFENKNKISVQKEQFSLKIILEQYDTTF